MRRIALTVSLAVALVPRAFAQCPAQAQAAAAVSPSAQNLSTGSGVTYSWTAPSASGVTGFEVVLSNGASTLAAPCSAAANATSCNGAALSAGSYTWAVRTQFSGCAGGVLSTGKTFTVGCPTNTPNPQQPSNGATNISTTPVLSWSAVSGADSYDIYLGPAGTGCSGQPKATTQTTSFTPPQLSASTTYEWKVVAKSSTTNCPGIASSCVTFTTAGTTCTAPGAFTLSSPANGATVSTTPTLTWTAASGTDKYVLHISTTNPPPVTTNDPIVSGSTTSYKPTLSPGTYYWYLDAYPNCSTSLKTSTQVSSFVVVSSCPTAAPTLVAPAGGVSVDASQAIAFQWAAVASATGYDVEVSADSGATFTSIGTTTSTTLSKNLNAGSYVWVVRALYGNACPAVVSGAASFKAVNPSGSCPTTSATLQNPPNNASNVATPVTFDWSDVSGATSYRLIASINGGTPAAIAVTSDSEATVNVPSGPVEWWVEASAGSTCASVVSQHFKFTAAGSTSSCPTSPGTPSLVLPANGANVTSPVTLQWTAVSGASGYRVYAVVSGDKLILGTTTATQLTTSLPQGAITWLVEAEFNGCPSTFSNTSSFTVTTPTSCSTTPATLQSPANGAQRVTAPVTFQWNGVSGATGYKLFIGTSANTGDFVALTTDTQVRNVTLPAGTYFWWIDTTFAGCPDAHAAPFSFTIPAATTCNGGTISTTSPAAGATVTSPVTLQWTPLSGASSYRVWVAINGGAPAVVAHSVNTSQQVSLPSGSVEWWVEGLFDNCPPVTSAHSTFTIQQSNSCGSNAAPVLTSPINNATASSPVEFDWNAAPNATSYRVWISVNGDPFVDLGFTKLTKLTHAVDFGSVQWFVEAIYDNCPPVASAKASFTIPVPPRCSGNDAPMTISPADGAQNVLAPVTLVWSAVPNAMEYRVFASLDAGDMRLIGTTTDATLTKNLPPGTIRWRVEATFDGCPSTRSARATFTIATNPACANTTAPAQLVSPRDGAQNVAQPVRFDWNPVNGATAYVVTIRHNDGVPTHVGETTDSQLVRDVPPGTIEWWVTTFFSGCPPLDSAHHSFSIPEPQCATSVRPLLLSPADSSTPIGSPVHFVWSKVPKAKVYKVWVAVDDAPPTVFGTPTDNKLTIDVPAGTATWFVEATFDTCPSVKSAPATFVVRRSSVACGTPARPKAAVAGQVASGTPYEVQWTAVDNANSYQLEESTSSDFSHATTQILTAIEATFTHSSTSPQRFFYRVRAISSCNDERSTFSPVVSIVVLPPNANASTTHHATVQVGTTTGITQQIQLPPQNPPLTFTAHGDKPWITVTPSNGTVGPNGATLTVTFDATALTLGTNTGSVVVTYSGSGKNGVNGSSTGNTPVSVSLVTPVSPGTKSTPPPDALIIPAVGHAPGANNSMFESDVRVANVSASLQKYAVSFTLTGADGTQSSSSTTIQIDPGTTLALDDILANFFGIGGDGGAATGVLEIRPTTSTSSNLASPTPPSIQTVASSRTYNNTPAGTYGQYIPAIPFAQFISKPPSGPATVLSLQQIANAAAYRTNVGFVEANGENANLLVHVFNNSGIEVAAPIPISLKPMQQIQLNGFLAANGINLTDGRIEVEVTSTTGKVTAYASVVDNVTNDPLLVLPVVKGAISSTRYVLPGIADINNGVAHWQSDMRIFNAGASPANVTLAYVPQPGNSGTDQTITYTLQPGEVKAIDNALQSLYGLSNSGGSVILTSDSASSLIATARTYNQTSNGTYGQFIPAISPAESVGAGDRSLQILQCESSDRYRTNIGVVETTGNPATVVISAITPDSKVSASTTPIPLAANEFRQISLASFGLGTIYNTRVTVKVIDGTGKVTAYGSLIDNTTQDPTYVPALRGTPL